jgi:hypothetical protein
MGEPDIIGHGSLEYHAGSREAIGKCAAVPVPLLESSGMAFKVTRGQSLGAGHVLPAFRVDHHGPHDPDIGAAFQRFEHACGPVFRHHDVRFHNGDIFSCAGAKPEADRIGNRGLTVGWNDSAQGIPLADLLQPFFYARSRLGFHENHFMRLRRPFADRIDATPEIRGLPGNRDDNGQKLLMNTFLPAGRIVLSFLPDDRFSAQFTDTLPHGLCGVVPGEVRPDEFSGQGTLGSGFFL